MQYRDYRYLLDVCEVNMADNFSIDLVFDHAVQKFENEHEHTSWERTITSGDGIFGYVGNNSLLGEYTLELYYRLGNNDIFANRLPQMNIKNITTTGYHTDDSGYRSGTLSYAKAYTLVYARSAALGYIYQDVYQSSSTWISSYFNLFHNYSDNNVAIYKLYWPDPTSNPEYIIVKLNAAHYGSEWWYGTIYNIQNSVLEVLCEPLDFNIQNVYPLDVNCRNDRTINIAWDYTNPRVGSLGSNVFYYPTESTVTVTQGQTVKTFTTTESYISCPIPANELTPGEATYKVTLTSNYGYSFDSPEQTFTLIGQTSAPEITNITQDSFPTITWNCADQAAWELLIKDNNSVVYHSEMKAGTEQSFTLPVMLEDGSYSVDMRALNIYGYYTDWGSYGFALSPTKPTAATNLIVSTNANYTVTIDCTAPEDAGTLYVVRRRTPNDKAEIIGEYNNGFTDYYVPVNTTYEYAVRNYVTGYADTDFIDATIKCPGVVIRDGEDLSRFIPLWKNDNEEFDVISNDSRSDTLVQCLGRKYPVNEIGEWLTSTRTFTAHVSSSDMLKLNDINLNSKCVYLQNKDECIPCKMEITDAGEYNGGGRIINFTLTRIDEEMA